MADRRLLRGGERLEKWREREREEGPETQRDAGPGCLPCI